MNDTKPYTSQAKSTICGMLFFRPLTDSDYQYAEASKEQDWVNIPLDGCMYSMAPSTIPSFDDMSESQILNTVYDEVMAQKDELMKIKENTNFRVLPKNIPVYVSVVPDAHTGKQKELYTIKNCFLNEENPFTAFSDILSVKEPLYKNQDWYQGILRDTVTRDSKDRINGVQSDSLSDAFWSLNFMYDNARKIQRLSQERLSLFSIFRNFSFGFR